jgi:hypothetical protein
LMRILVVCNSLHHSLNTLLLAEQLIAIAGHGEVVAFCEPGNESYFESGSDARITRVLPFAPATLEALDTNAAISTNDHVYKVNGAVKFVELLYRRLARFRAQSKSEFVRILIDFLRNTTAGSYLQQRRLIRYYRTQVFLAEKLIKEYAPTMVLAYGDRHIDFELSILTSARRHKIRILLPYSTYSGVSGMVKIRELQGNYSKYWPFSLYRLYATLRLKAQIRDGQFWQHPSLLMALDQLKMLTSNPWCMGNGPADIVCVDNAGTLERYVEEGVPRSKLRVVGDTAYDALFTSFASRENLRESMISERLIYRERKTVVIALPQFAEQGLMDWPEHWREIESLLSEVCECGQNILVSLHPRVNPADYRHLESEYPLRFAREPLKNLLPVADVFVAVNSSTVFWSVLCGIPVVVLDYFGLDSSLFADLDSLVYVRDRNALGKAVKKALFDADPDFAADWRRLSRDQVFDGQVARRYYELTKV